MMLDISGDIKSLQHYSRLVEVLMEQKTTRKSCLVAVGGGHLTDLVGYIASTYMRGIDFIQVPTTLMSMADAVIGKVAIDHGEHKNLLGAFTSPRYVLCDPLLLNTLPPTQKADGLVEVWKHALLVTDDEARQRISKLLDNNLEGDYADLVRFSLDTKRAFVEADPTDTTGAHAALSLGHTLSNVLEKGMEISHGAGVLCGIVHAAVLARNLGAISDAYFEYIVSTARKLGHFLPRVTASQKWIKPRKMVELLKFDKINPKGALRLILMTDKGYEMTNLLSEQLLHSFTEYKQLKLT